MEDNRCLPHVLPSAGTCWRSPGPAAKEVARFVEPCFDFSIDGKLWGRDVVKVRIADLLSGGQVRTRATVVQQKAGRPVQFELLEPAQASISALLARRGARSIPTPSRAVPTKPNTSSRDNTRGWSTNGSPSLGSGTRPTARAPRDGRKPRDHVDAALDRASTLPPTLVEASMPAWRQALAQHSTPGARERPGHLLNGWSSGRNRNGCFRVSNGDKQTFAHGAS